MSADKEETLYERTMRRLKNNPFVVAILVIGTIAIGLLQGVDVFSKIKLAVFPSHAQFRELHIRVQPYDIARGYAGSPILNSPTLENDSNVNAVAKHALTEILNIVQPLQSGDYVSTLEINGDLLRSDKPLKGNIIVVTASNPAMQQPLGRVQVLDLSSDQNLTGDFHDSAFFSTDCSCIHFVEMTAPSGGYKGESVDVYQLTSGYSFDPKTLITTKKLDLVVAPVSILVQPSQGGGASDTDIRTAQTDLDRALLELLQGNAAIVLSPYKTLDELKNAVSPEIQNIPIGAGKEDYLFQHRVDFVITVTFVMR